MEVWQQDWVSKWALYSPNKIALQEHDTNRAISYFDLNAKANGIAQYLLDHESILVGDRIAVITEFSIELVALFSAAQKLGFTIVPINYRLAAAEITAIIHDASPTLVIYEFQFLDLVRGVMDHKMLEISELLKVNPSNSNTIQLVDEDDPLFIIYTSGTTGKPKGVIYTHKMAFWNSVNTSISLKINAESRTLNVMPPFHTGGWNVLLLPFIHHGGFTYLFRKFEASQVVQKLEELSCNVFMGVPTMLSMMAREPIFVTSNLDSLDYMIVGGESMPVPLIEIYASKGVAIRQGYGMTEVGPNLTSLHQDDAIRKKGSIGRPNFYVQHRIVAENGENVIANQAGELWLRGPMTTIGYWRNEEETKKAFSSDGKWFKTGDIVIEDDDKYLYIVDRLKNMYISGGENVYPAEIEVVIKNIPDIINCAIIGVKDEKWGEVGKAFVVVSAPTAEQDILKHCLLFLAKFKIPKYIVFLDKMPLTASGKIDRNLLKFL